MDPHVFGEYFTGKGASPEGNDRDSENTAEDVSIRGPECFPILDPRTEYEPVIENGEIVALEIPYRDLGAFKGH